MKNQALASFMRIRHYVFDWLAASKGSVMRLPSSRELAEKFEVSQPTVVRALQELVKEGFLTNRPGVGLFSNPGKLATREGRIWGIVFGDGRWAFLSRDAFHMASCIGQELLARDNHNLLKLITMGETQQEQFPELSMLSGICWWCGEEKVIPNMRRIAETTPVVVLSGRIPGFDCYYYDFEAENYEIARWMIENGARRLALVMSGDHPEAVVGVERACAEAGLTFPAGYVLGPDRESEQELDRMGTLVQNLLKIARWDAGTVVLEKSPQCVCDLMERVRGQYAFRAEREGKALSFEGDDAVTLLCDPHWMAEAVGNLVKNALDHTARGDHIAVTWSGYASLIRIVVRDSGSGIAPEDLPHIFKRFYRSRFSQDTQGVGLGLPLAKAVIEAHSGTITVDSAPGQGTVFTIGLLIPTTL